MKMKKKTYKFDRDEITKMVVRGLQLSDDLDLSEACRAEVTYLLKNNRVTGVEVVVESVDDA